MQNTSPIDIPAGKMKSLTNVSTLRGDLFGGLTAGIVALPLALAFGKQTELGAIAGLYGAIAMSMMTALFASTRSQVSGPTAPMTVVSVQAISEAILLKGSVQAAYPFIIAIFLCAGLLQMLLGVFGFGKYVKYMPFPVVSGFMTGIGLMLIITQLFPLIGANPPLGGALGTLTSLDNLLHTINPVAVGLAAATIALIYAIPYITKIVPSSLIALILVSVASYYFLPVGSFLKIESEGAVPSVLPSIRFEFFNIFADLHTFGLLFKYSVILAFLASIDSLLTSVMVDRLLKEKHNSKRELIGQGIANFCSGLIGGLPGASATMRTMINIKAGGRGRLSGFVAGTVVLIVLLGLGSLIGKIPNAVLAGILLTVGISIIDWHGLYQATKVPRSDAAVMIIVIFLTVFVDLIVAVAAGVLLASLFFMKTISDSTEKRSSLISFEEFPGGEDEKKFVKAHAEEIFVQNFDGPLFFGSAIAFSDMIQNVSNLKAIIMHMERVNYLDQSGLHVLEEALQDMQRQGIIAVVTGLHDQPLELLEKTGVVPNLLPKTHCFDTFEECAHWLENALSVVS